MSILSREDWDLEIHDHKKQTRRALSNTPRVLNLLAIAEPQGVDQELSCRELGSATRKQAHPTQRNSEVEEQEFCKMCETYKRCCASGVESYIHAHRCLILVHGCTAQMGGWAVGPLRAGACH